MIFDIDYRFHRFLMVRVTVKNLSLLILAAVFLIAITAVILYEQKSVVGYDTLATNVGPSGSDGQLVQSPADAPFSSVNWNSETTGPASADGPRQPFEAGVVKLGVGAPLGGKLPFPSDSPWNQRIDDALVDPMSRTIISRIGLDKNLHPDFGAGEWQGAPIGIPYVVVGGDQPKVPVVYTLYGDQSDPGPFPIPPFAHIEGHPNEDGDRHVIVLDRDNWKLYELFRSFSIGDGQLWRAESGAVFDMNEHPSRPVGWTSADAAGLPIFPGLVRYDEVVELGEIKHALRFTVSETRRAFVHPASHWASRSNDVRLPPMGMRVRLRSDFDMSDFPPEAQVILTALKRYGMILADNGSDWFISGCPDPRWNDDALRTLKQVTGRDFEVVLMENIVSED